MNQKSNEHIDNVLRLTINGEKFKWHKQYITGLEIRKLGKIPDNEKLFLAIKKPWKDELILNDTRINIARPTIEHFFSEGPGVGIVLMVNGRPKNWNKRKIRFKELVILAFGTYDENPNIVYTVTYDQGPPQNPEGSMVKGDEVFVKNNMIFNVTATDKS